MADAPLDVVTGATGFTGRRITDRLLDKGRRVRSLTGHMNKPDPFDGKVEVTPYRFDDPVELARSMEGATTFYNTYWVRFAHGKVTRESSIENSRALFNAAKQAGVERIVHISIANPSVESRSQYFRGKALVERALAETGVPYAIVRPTVVFGEGGLFMNNIAWLLRKFPMFALPAGGEYPLRPVYVGDVADMCVQGGQTQGNTVTNAMGPETFSFERMIRLIRTAVNSNCRLFRVPAAFIPPVTRAIGFAMKDVLLTKEELIDLSENLSTVEGEPTGKTVFTDWLQENGPELGLTYSSELARHF